MQGLGWTMARWNVALYLGVAALVYAVGGLDPIAALAG